MDNLNDAAEEVVTSKSYDMSEVPERLRPVVECLITATEIFQDNYDTIENLIAVAEDIDEIYGKRGAVV